MRRLIAWLGLLMIAVSVWGGSRDLANAYSPTVQTQPQRTLDVVGKGTVTAQPDTAVITLGVTALAETPTASYKAAGKALASVASALKELGVKHEDIKTTELHLGAEYEWTQEKGQVLKGYRTSTSLSVTTQALDQVATLVEAAVDAGANQLQTIQFSVKDPEALMQQATDLAVDNARSKAERVATRMGTAVAGVLKVTVSDDSGSIVRAPILMESAKGAADALPVFGGTARYSVTVSATFELN